MMVQASKVAGHCWLFDSGATQHMSNSSVKFVKKVPYTHSTQIANNSRIPVVSKNDALLEGRNEPITIKNVLQVPGLSMNLLSISQICSNGFKVIFDKVSCQVIDYDGKVFATGTQDNGHYIFDTAVEHAM